MPTTPPPRTVVHTPPTPLHGARFDNWNSRKSTRQSSRRSQPVETTPPPASTIHPSTSRNYTHNLSPPSSNPTSPQTRGNKRRRGNLNGNTDITSGESSISTSAHVDPSANFSNGGHPEQGTLHLGPDMLPTPAKTPRKKDLRKTAEFQSAARVLFPTRLENVEEAMPTKKSRRARKNVGFSLDSSGDFEDSESRIQIFTDSKEKLPELDLSESNPFIDRPEDAGSFEPRKSTGRRGRSTAVKTDTHIENVFNHEQGMIYVFRGKKIYRPFPSDPDHPNMSSEETEIEGSTPPPFGPSTRASVKPRLLFPTEKQRRERELAEEEALTDIEDCRAAKTEEKPVTPLKQSFTTAPATPPATGHATRSATRKAALSSGNSPLGAPELFFEETTTSVGRRPRKKTSPFDSWQRTKGRKRGSEHMDKDVVDAGSKKLKSNASA